MEHVIIGKEKGVFYIDTDNIDYLGTTSYGTELFCATNSMRYFGRVMHNNKAVVAYEMVEPYAYRAYCTVEEPVNVKNIRIKKYFPNCKEIREVT